MIFELRCHFLHEAKSLKAYTTSVPLQREDCDFRQLQTGVTRLEVKVRTLPRPSLAQSSLISKRRPPNSFQDGPPQKSVVNGVFSQRIAFLKPRFRPNRGASKRACGIFALPLEPQITHVLCPIRLRLQSVCVIDWISG